MIFLGAGLSFGVGRRMGRGAFETPPPIADDARFPSWLMLADRMKDELIAGAHDESEKRAYEASTSRRLVGSSQRDFADRLKLTSPYSKSGAAP
jgi:hypothetical protein